MITAFILIIMKSGDENKVIEKLKGHPMVKEVYKVYGEYDMIVKLEVEGISGLDEFYDKVLRRVREVGMTEILIASSYEGVIKANSVTGPYDAIVEVEATDLEELRRIIRDMQNVDGVLSVITEVVGDLEED